MSGPGLRKYPRIPYRCDVYVLDNEGYGFVLDSENLSRGGVFLKTQLLLEEGQQVLVKFESPTGQPIVARGHVARAEARALSKHSAGMGIKFDYVDRRSRQVLAQLTAEPREHSVA